MICADTQTFRDINKMVEFGNNALNICFLQKIFYCASGGIMVIEWE